MYKPMGDGAGISWVSRRSAAGRVGERARFGEKGFPLHHPINLPGISGTNYLDTLQSCPLSSYIDWDKMIDGMAVDHASIPS